MPRFPRRPAIALLLAGSFLLLGTGTASAAVVKLSVSYKIVTVPLDGDACSKRILAVFPHVKDVSNWYKHERHFGDDRYTRSPVAPPFDDVVKSPKGKVVNRAAKGSHQLSIASVTGAHCESLDEDVDRLRASRDVYVSAVTGLKRVIKGQVEVACKEEPSCPRGGGLQGARIAVGATKTTTGADGRYAVAVKPGKYTVRADGVGLRIAKASRRVDVTRAKTATADFSACGLKETAGLSNVGGGDWIGGSAACRNAFKVSWRPSQRSLSVSWKSAPTCGLHVQQPELLLKDSFVNTATKGHTLTVDPAFVAFRHPVGTATQAFAVTGRLLADGGGVAAARLEIGACTYSTSDIPIKRK